MVKRISIQKTIKRKTKKASRFVEGFPQNTYTALMETRKMIGEEQFQSIRKVLSKCSNCDIEFKYGIFEAEFSIYCDEKIRLRLTRNHKAMADSREYYFSPNILGISARKDEDVFIY